MKKLSPYLTFAGAVPFVVGAVLITLGVSNIPILGEVSHILSTYGLVIASFMAGAQWGNHLTLPDSSAWVVNLPLLSNIITIGLWLGFLSLTPAHFIWLLIMGFIILLVVDYGLDRAQIIEHKYFKVRLYVTSVVIISLAIAAMQL